MNFFGFDYITIAGRKLFQQEYNETTVDFLAMESELDVEMFLKRWRQR
jgi:hypothetical protein